MGWLVSWVWFFCVVVGGVGGKEGGGGAGTDAIA